MNGQLLSPKSSVAVHIEIAGEVIAHGDPLPAPLRLQHPGRVVRAVPPGDCRRGNSACRALEDRAAGRCLRMLRRDGEKQQGRRNSNHDSRPPLRAVGRMIPRLWRPPNHHRRSRAPSPSPGTLGRWSDSRRLGHRRVNRRTGLQLDCSKCPLRSFRSRLFARGDLSGGEGGRPLLYNGQEVESPQKLGLFERIPVRWSQPRRTEAQTFYRRVIQIARTDAMLASGPLAPVTTSAPDDVIGYRRGAAAGTSTR